MPWASERAQPNALTHTYNPLMFARERLFISIILNLLSFLWNKKNPISFSIQFKKYSLFYITKKDVERIFLAIPYYSILHTIPCKNPFHTHTNNKYTLPFLVSNISSVRWLCWPKQVNEWMNEHTHCGYKGWMMYTLYNRFVYTQHNEKNERKSEKKLNWNNVNDGRAYMNKRACKCCRVINRSMKAGHLPFCLI